MALVNKIEDYFSVSTVQQALSFASAVLAISVFSASSVDYIAGGICAFAALFNQGLAVRQYHLMSRLENAIKEHGYDPRMAKPFMETYCGREIVERVLEKNNLSEEYNSLTE